MVSATGGAQNSTAAGILLSTTTPSVSSSSFTQQLAAALEQYLGQAGNSSGLEIDIRPSQSQNSGGSQFLVTVKTATPAPSSFASSVAPAAHGVQNTPLTPAATTTNSADTSGANPAYSETSGTPGSASTPPAGYQNVPFGTSYTTIPTLDAEIAASNKENMILAKICPDSITNGMASAMPGDPMNGQTVPGGTMKWNDLTQNQQMACQYAMLCGLPQGQGMDQFLASYAGPKAWWNAPYSNPSMFGAPPAAGSVDMYHTPYIDPNA